MHFLNITKIRFFIIFVLIILVWQIIRNWPQSLIVEVDQDEHITKTVGLPIMVMVYYEALCPDSKHFIMKQLEVVYKKAPTLIEYQLVPYGKATTTVNKDGSLKFECQHGPIECEANMYHACTIEAVEDQKTLIRIISCMIKDNMIPKQAMKKCTKENDIDSEPIQKCYDSPHGAELLKIHGEATDMLRPKVSFIPTVTLDGSQGKQALILKDLFTEVCKVASSGGQTPPKICL